MCRYAGHYLNTSKSTNLLIMPLPSELHQNTTSEYTPCKTDTLRGMITHMLGSLGKAPPDRFLLNVSDYIIQHTSLTFIKNLDKSVEKHSTQTNNKTSVDCSEWWWIVGKRHRGWSQIAKISNAMQLPDAWANSDGSPINKQEIGGCYNYAETTFWGLEDAVELWDIDCLGVESCNWA